MVQKLYDKIELLKTNRTKAYRIIIIILYAFALSDILISYYHGDYAGYFNMKKINLWGLITDMFSTSLTYIIPTEIAYYITYGSLEGKENIIQRDFQIVFQFLYFGIYLLYFLFKDNTLLSIIFTIIVFLYSIFIFSYVTKWLSTIENNDDIIVNNTPIVSIASKR